MKEYIRQQIAGIDNNNLARCVVREYLQARLLECLQDSGAFASWAFVGGTALRFLYGMPRFSEDLDFSLVRSGADVRFEKFLEKTEAVLKREGYSIGINAKTDKTVQSAFIKYAGLLYELGLSPHPSETVSIKVEIDTHPPEGAGLETSVIRRHVLLNLLHYDKPSLLAGKLHALLAREYVKGRDVYDLVWYLSDRTWPPPNVTFLNCALDQTGRHGLQITMENWRQQIALRVKSLDWKKVISDVRPFLERQQDLDLLNEQVILRLLENR
jgi:predicted nucleotidyltransferase component of viral defense system